MADGRTLFCRIITPEQTVFDGEVERVIATVSDGEIGVLPDHAPLIATTKIGSVRISQGDDYIVFATSDGFFKTSENLVQVLVEEAVRATEIDVEAADTRVADAERSAEEFSGEGEDDIKKRQAAMDKERQMGENLAHVARKYGDTDRR